MSLQVEKPYLKEIFNEEPYRSILIILSCFDKGLEQKHLAYELVRATINKKGKSTKNNKPCVLKEPQIQNYLQNKKRIGCFYKNKIKVGCIPHRQRLNECLGTLIKNKVVIKGLKRYVIRPVIREQLIMNFDLDSIFLPYISAFFGRMLISSKYVNIYTPGLAIAYHEDEKIKKQVDSIISDIEKSIEKLDIVNKKAIIKRQKQELIYYNKILNKNINYYVDLIDGERKYLDLNETDKKRLKKTYEHSAELAKKYIKQPHKTPITIIAHNLGTGERVYPRYNPFEKK